MLTNQKALNRSIKALRKQKKKVAKLQGGNLMCFYRGLDGCKCGIGWLIPDKCYKKAFEGASIGLLMEIYSQTQIFGEKVENIQFIMKLQRVHDSLAVSEWEDGWIKLATEYKLRIPK